jgi:hypothetical protein
MNTDNEVNIDNVDTATITTTIDADGVAIYVELYNNII